MNQLETLIEEAKEFLDQNSEAQRESDHWYAIDNFHKCLSSAEADPSKSV